MDQVSEARSDVPRASGTAWLDLARPTSDVPIVLLWLGGSLLALLLLKVDVAVGLVTAIGTGLCVGALSLMRAPYTTHLAPVNAHSTVRAIACWLNQHELYLLLAFSPLFLVPLRPFAFVVALIPLLALARWLARGYLTLDAPLNLPALLLLLLMGPSFFVAADWELAWPKVVGLLFGIGLYLAILNLPAESDITRLSQALAVTGFAVVLIALVGTDWPLVGKLPIYENIYQILPRLIHALPPSISRVSTINPNETGGVLDWIAPFLIALWVGQFSARTRTGWLWRAFLIAAIALSSAVLFLTQSRGAIVAFTVTLAILVAIYVRPFRWLLLAAVLVASLAVIVMGPGAVVEAVVGAEPNRLSNSTELNLHGRMLIWQQALAAVRAYPLFGVGLNQFDLVRNQVGVAAPDLQDRLVIHAHNTYLQSAIDFGLPGLVAYVALLTGALGVLLIILRDQQSRAAHALAAALFVGLLAHQLLGLTDAITLGAKPGFILWALLGATAWLWVNRRANP